MFLTPDAPRLGLPGQSFTQPPVKAAVPLCWLGVYMSTTDQLSLCVCLCCLLQETFQRAHRLLKPKYGFVQEGDAEAANLLCMPDLTLVVPVSLACRRLSHELQRLMKPKYGFAQEGDAETALNGFGTAGGIGTDGVAAACCRAASAHKLFNSRLLPRLQVRETTTLMGLGTPVRMHLLASVWHQRDCCTCSPRMPACCVGLASPCSPLLQIPQLL